MIKKSDALERPRTSSYISRAVIVIRAPYLGRIMEARDLPAFVISIEITRDRSVYEPCAESISLSQIPYTRADF